MWTQGRVISPSLRTLIPLQLLPGIRRGKGQLCVRNEVEGVRVEREGPTRQRLTETDRKAVSLGVARMTKRHFSFEIIFKWLASNYQVDFFPPLSN